MLRNAFFLDRKSQARAVKFVSGVVLSGCIAAFVIGTRHWTLISDAVLMHYVVFLTHHGLAPYRDVIDINLPGTYLLDSAVVQTFGATAAGWRAFDFVLLLLASAAMLIIAWPYSRPGGALAAALFVLLHGADGVAHAGQRDFTVAVLLLVGCALLLKVFRQGAESGGGGGRFAGALAWGLSVGMAATIKPQFLLSGAAGLLLIAVLCKRRRCASGRPLIAGALGIVIPLSAVLCFLVRGHVFQPFITRIMPLISYHASMGRHTVGFLLAHAIPPKLFPIILAAFVVAWWRWAWSKWEGALLLSFAGVGLFSFVAQGKAYSYHRAPLLAFVLCLATVQLACSLTAKEKAIRVTSLVALMYAGLWLVPASTVKALRWNCTEPSLTLLQQDLTSLHASSLEGQRVQCMDTFAGCITVLSRMQLVQSTGFLYDCYLFAPQADVARERERKQFLKAVEKSPPAFYVVTDQWFRSA